MYGKVAADRARSVGTSGATGSFGERVCVFVDLYEYAARISRDAGDLLSGDVVCDRLSMGNYGLATMRTNCAP